MTALPARVAALGGIALGRWSPEPAGDGRRGMSVMEAAAWVAGEPVSDHPACVSPILSTFLRSLNDDWDDEERQTLKPYVTLIVGTGGDGHDKARAYLALDWWVVGRRRIPEGVADKARAYLALDWWVRTYAPAWLDLAGLNVESEALRGLPRIVDKKTEGAARVVAERARCRALDVKIARIAEWRGSSAGASTAAWKAAEDAAFVATSVTGRAAWRTGQDVADWDGPHSLAADTAADDAALTMALVGAWKARTLSELVNPLTRDGAVAVGLATRAGADDALAPTIKTLQASLLDLLDRMIDPEGAVG